ncbi:MAG: rhodanese-like domain-containing protein [Bryobacteraceae bacterium]
MNRRAFFASCAAALAFADRSAWAKTAAQNPWPPGALIEPAALVKQLASNGNSLHVLCVTFPFLYDSKHIPGAQFAGPGRDSEGIAKLTTGVKHLPKDASIVIYCGCCPMEKCPNIRPAYRALRKDGFRNVRVLDLPTNFYTDWVKKGYPVESGKAS